MNSEATGFFIYLLSFWVIFFIVYKIFKLENYGVEFKPYLTILCKTRKLNNLISRIALSMRSFWKVLFTIGIFLAIGELFFITSFFVRNIFYYYYKISEIQPVIPLIPGLTISLNALPYFIVAALFIFIFHEFSHGISANIENLNVKSVGIIFAVFIGGGFVELDEEEMKTANFLSKLRILASGSTINLLTGVIALFMIANFSYVIYPFYELPSGVTVIEVIEGSPAKIYGIKYGDILFGIDGVKVNDVYDFTHLLNTIPANSTIVLNTNRGDIVLIGGVHPYNYSKIFIGVRVFNYYPPRFSIPFLDHYFPYHYYNFLNWFEVISLSAALINMLPIPFFDGGRFFEVLFNHKIFILRKINFIGHNINIGEILLEVLRGISVILLFLNISQSFLLNQMISR
ncbi:MAG: site-2 protease family protein [Candidatus Methanomethylicia archaeon]